MNQPTQGVSGAVGIGLGAIQKKWEEQTDAEKIETLRNELRDYRYLITRIARLEESMHRMRQHEHGSKGEILVPISSADAQSNFAAQTYDRLA